jgi:hypothetical protein
MQIGRRDQQGFLCRRGYFDERGLSFSGPASVTVSSDEIRESPHGGTQAP